MPGRLLTQRECAALDALTGTSFGDHFPMRRLPRIAAVTLGKLAKLGLVEEGNRAHWPTERGWRLTDDGWRCMFGKTEQEIIDTPDYQSVDAFTIWRWPRK